MKGSRSEVAASRPLGLEAETPPASHSSDEHAHTVPSQKHLARRTKEELLQEFSRVRKETKDQAQMDDLRAMVTDLAKNQQRLSADLTASLHDNAEMRAAYQGYQQSQENNLDDNHNPEDNHNPHHKYNDNHYEEREKPSILKNLHSTARQAKSVRELIPIFRADDADAYLKRLEVLVESGVFAESEDIALPLLVASTKKGEGVGPGASFHETAKAAGSCQQFLEIVKRRFMLNASTELLQGVKGIGEWRPTPKNTPREQLDSFERVISSPAGKAARRTLRRDTYLVAHFCAHSTLYNSTMRLAMGPEEGENWILFRETAEKVFPLSNSEWVKNTSETTTTTSRKEIAEISAGGRGDRGRAGRGGRGGGRAGAGSGGRGLSQRCHTCWDPGHTEQQCRKAAPTTGGSRRCFRCKTPGHDQKDCKGQERPWPMDGPGSNSGNNTSGNDTTTGSDSKGGGRGGK